MRAIFIDVEKCLNIADWKSQVLGNYVELCLHVHIHRDIFTGIRQNVNGVIFKE